MATGATIAPRSSPGSSDASTDHGLCALRGTRVDRRLSLAALLGSVDPNAGAQYTLIGIASVALGG